VSWGNRGSLDRGLVLKEGRRINKPTDLKIQREREREKKYLAVRGVRFFGTAPTFVVLFWSGLEGIEI
jgi:hypothetical protein